MVVFVIAVAAVVFVAVVVVAAVSESRIDGLDVLASQSLWCQIGLTHRLTCDCHPLNIVVAVTVDKCHQQDLFLKPPRSKFTLYPFSFTPFQAI